MIEPKRQHELRKLKLVLALVSQEMNGSTEYICLYIRRSEDLLSHRSTISLAIIPEKNALVTSETLLCNI